MGEEHILIVDDKIEIITFLTDLLRPMGYRVSFATHGDEGLTKALRDGPDLILLDLNMPGMSGLDVLEALRARQYRTPVILMTLYGSESVAVRAFRLGVRDYVTKPFNIEELLGAVERGLEQARLRRERERLVAELSEANNQLKQRMEELAALQAIGRSVAELMPRELLLRRILDAAMYLAVANAGAVFLRDPLTGDLCLEAVRHGKTFQFGLRARVQDSHADDALQSIRPVYIAAPSKRTGLTGYLGAPAGSLIYVPVHQAGDAIGVLCLARRKDQGELPGSLLNRLLAMSDYAAIALHNARLYEDSEWQAQQLVTINGIGQMIAASLDLSQIMPVVVRAVKAILGVERAVLMLRSEEDADQVFEIVLGTDMQERGPLRIEAAQGVAGWVFQNGCALRINDVTRDDRYVPAIDDIAGVVTRSVLCVPLIASRTAMGAIEAVNKLDDREPGGAGSFTDRDERLLEELAVFVAIAIENARLHAATRRSVAAETLQSTMVTLAHYIRNPLQIILGLTEALRDELGTLPTANRSADEIERQVRQIAAVLTVLQDITTPESAVYLGSIQMIDIECELQARLHGV